MTILFRCVLSGRNRQVSLRMPKFKDTRKNGQNACFNGWVDDQEPKSPLADLFARLGESYESYASYYCISTW
jgi:hypothetical protein